MTTNTEKKPIRILFQGDSITDAGRTSMGGNATGQGYATMVAADLGLAFPGKYEFINRGINGSRVVDLYGRIRRDFEHLQPDVISILIGVNDVWHEYDVQNGVPADRFETVYRMLLQDLQKDLPGVKLLLFGPFVLPGTATAARIDEFRQEVALRAAAAQKVAEELHLPYAALQPLFDEACEKAEPSYWLQDGVHPTAAGHRLLANEWLRLFRTLQF